MEGTKNQIGDILGKKLKFKTKDIYNLPDAEGEGLVVEEDAFWILEMNDLDKLRAGGNKQEVETGLFRQLLS